MKIGGVGGADTNKWPISGLKETLNLVGSGYTLFIFHVIVIYIIKKISDSLSPGEANLLQTLWGKGASEASNQNAVKM